MMLKEKKGFLFDLNGTMIDDMQYHIGAWHHILNELGANISLERMKEECYGKNDELLERMFPGRFSAEEKSALSQNKEEQYRQNFKPQLKGINGLEEFLKGAEERGIKMAIGSAAVMDNIDFVLDGLHIRHYIKAIVSADNVTHSKPHPETFLKCAQGLQLPPEACVVFEDAPKGVEAALNAGMDCVVLTTLHEPHEFSQFNNVIGFARDFTEITIG